MSILSAGRSNDSTNTSHYARGDPEWDTLYKSFLRSPGLKGEDAVKEMGSQIETALAGAGSLNETIGEIHTVCGRVIVTITT